MEIKAKNKTSHHSNIAKKTEADKYDEFLWSGIKSWTKLLAKRQSSKNLNKNNVKSRKNKIKPLEKSIERKNSAR